MSKTIFVINGPNLNLLGQREPEIYGRQTLDDIRLLCEACATPHGLAVDFRQANGEGALVDTIQEARKSAAGIVINAAAYTHTSVAIRDALAAADKPVVEVHLSNVHAREPFRHHSYIADIAVGVICGFGAQGYVFAIEGLAKLIAEQK